MILSATGHPGLDQFLKTQESAEMTMFDSWAALRKHLSPSAKVFLGQQVKGFMDALGWMADHHDLIKKEQWALWLGETFDHPVLTKLSDSVTIWRGEIDGDALITWLGASTAPVVPLKMARLFVLISLHPYHPAYSVIRSLTGLADRLHGSGGGWVDLDWYRAELSLRVAPKLYQSRDAHTLAKAPIRWGRNYLIPAPPPWTPGAGIADEMRMAKWVRLPWSWQGWYVGAEFSTAEAIYAIREIPDLIFITSDETPLWLLKKAMEFCRLYRPDLRAVLAGPSRPSGSDGDWEFVPTNHEEGTTMAEPFWKFSRRKKE